MRALATSVEILCKHATFFPTVYRKNSFETPNIAKTYGIRSKSNTFTTMKTVTSVRRRFTNVFPTQTSLHRCFTSRSALFSSSASTPVLDAQIVPEAPTAHEKQIEELAKFVSYSRNLLLLTGAGFSPNGAYSKGHKPILHKEFSDSSLARQRYWARSMTGWKAVLKAMPNEGHFAAAKMEQIGIIKNIVTQNVDRLHLKAGSKAVLELHGHLDSVICLNCGTESSRERFQQRLEEFNKDWLRFFNVESEVMRTLKPDGDVDLQNADYSKFVVPSCENCNRGPLKPTVVFFGDNVPKPVADRAMQLVSQADSLLVGGSSLMVFSAMRYIKAAVEKKIPIAVVNIGPTRADELVNFKLEARCADVFSRLVKHLQTPTSTASVLV